MTKDLAVGDRVRHIEDVTEEFPGVVRAIDPNGFFDVYFEDEGTEYKAYGRGSLIAEGDEPMRNPIAIILNLRYWGTSFEAWHNCERIVFKNGAIVLEY